MAEFRKSIDNLPLIVKIILALPFLDLIWAIYRICRGDSPAIIFGILWIVIGSCTVLWLVDVIFLAMGKNVWELSDSDIAALKNIGKEENTEESKQDENKGE